jgi:hypothetical protein
MNIKIASACGIGVLYLFAGILPAQAIDAFAEGFASLDEQSQNSQSVKSAEVSKQTLSDQKVTIALTKDKTQADSSVAQVTSVSQLSDVQPNDWAFGALQSLVERYGCIAGYPNGTFRGNRALSRYEFAAGLNACLDRVNELIGTATADLPSKQDMMTLQKLQEDFSTELATLRGRVDVVEARTTELEKNQFSTTTKLSGEAIVAAIGAKTKGSGNQTVVLNNRVRLNLTSSFTGKDLLITGLQAHNFLGGVDGSNSVQGSLGLSSSILSASSARTGFEPQFPGVDPKTLSPVSANSVQLYKLLYIFPVAKKLTLFAGTGAEVSDAFPAVTPFYGEGQESISRFGNLNPVVRVSGGTSGSGLASAAGFIYSISPQLDLRALYGSVNANLPQNGSEIDPVEAPGVLSTPLGSGVFGGSSVVATQLTFKPTKSIDIGLNYANSYHQINILGTGLTSSDIGSGFDSGAMAGVPLGTPVKLNSFGGTVNLRFSPKVSLAGYGAAMFVDDSSNSVDASTTFTSWMVGLHFNDLIKRGNNAGLLFGQPLYRTEASGKAVLADDLTTRTVPYHLEGYYRFRVNDNVSITPGAIVLFNPEGNSANDTTAIGVLRTTFTF